LRFVSVPLLVPLALMLLLAVPFVHAADADLEKIKEPLDRVYSVIQTLVSVVGVIVISFAGFKFMVSGENLQARESSKHMMGYAVMGLLVIWMAPYLVNYLVVV